MKSYRNYRYELILTTPQIEVLDFVSNSLRKHYNSLLSICIEDYSNGNELKLLTGFNLRNYSCNVTKQNDECKNFHSPLVKNTAIRIKETFKGLFKHNRGFPKYKSYYGKWFSLYYEELGIIPKFNKQGLLEIKLGKDLDNNKLNFFCKVKGLKQIPKGTKTARITKDNITNKYYITYCCEVFFKDVEGSKDKWISIDQNHKNMFMAIDYKGKSINFRKSLTSKYFNEKIDSLKAKRDKKIKHSRRFNKLNDTIKKYYHKRDSQLKKEIYTIANFLNKNYNHIAIGDYTPTASDIKNINKTIITDSLVGKLREVIGEVAVRYSNRYELINEAYTTMTCCLTNVKQKRSTDEREWFVNDIKVLRDLNSAVNIAKKSKFIKKLNVQNCNISSINEDYYFNYKVGLQLI